MSEVPYSRDMISKMNWRNMAMKTPENNSDALPSGWYIHAPTITIGKNDRAIKTNVFLEENNCFAVNLINSTPFIFSPDI